MKSRIKPSFLVNFLPLLISKSENKAAIIKNVLAIKNGDRSLISNGETKAIDPKTKVVQIITDPIKFPKTIQFFSFLADIIEK